MPTLALTECHRLHSPGQLQSVQSCPSGPWQFPEITLGYSDDQKQPILWKILPGFSDSGHVLTWLGYNFKLVQPTGPEGYSQMVIIEDHHQILPVAVIHL